MLVTKKCAITDKINDTSKYPKTEYSISDQGLNVITPVP